MIILNGKLFSDEQLYKISNKDDIKNTKPNSTLLFAKNSIRLMQYCFENDIAYAVEVESLKDSIYANKLNAKYIISDKKLAKEIQKLADNYLFDSKILALIECEDEIEEIAKEFIDGVVFTPI